MPLTNAKLLASHDLGIRYVKCRPEHRGISDVEHQNVDSLVFPLIGSFVKHFGPRTTVLAEPSVALFFAEGRPYRISHPGPLHDECLVLEFDPGVIRSALIDITQIDHLGDSRLHTHAGLTLRAATICSLLLWRLRHGISDALEATETSLALLAATVRAALQEKIPTRTRPETRTRRGDQVMAVQSMLLASTEATPHLSELATHAETTPFHLTRIFREHVGVPVHEYDMRLRLMRALPDLLDTDRGITEIALDYGFSSHSHFTYAFRRRAGITPNGLRRIAKKGTRREVSKIVIALSEASTYIII
jgi:AraC-like DNA-binding protein